MLSSPNRLHKKIEIERVFKRGRSVYSGDLGMRFAPNNLATSRFSVVVSLKVSKKSNRRNLLKRRLREILRRDIVPHLGKNIDGVILTKAELLDLSFTELKELAVSLFLKARLIKERKIRDEKIGLVEGCDR